MRNARSAFATPLRQLHLDVKNPAHLSGLCHLDNLMLAGQILLNYQDWQNPSPPMTQA